MYLNVKERGDHVATFRWIAVRLMEMLAAWVPTTPEMEVKLVFGAHIWEAAQHADLLGKRTHELRLPMHDNLEPVRGYVDLLADVARVEDTSRRIVAFYDGLLPDLERRFRRYLERVDTLLDEPTVRIVERIMADMARMTAESRALEELPAVKQLIDRAWLDGLRRRAEDLDEIVGQRAAGSPAAAVTGR
jgi:hypothetical protein